MSITSESVKTEYGKQWVYLNPDKETGPFNWNTANFPPAGDPIIPDNIDNIYTTVPMMSTVDGQEVNLFFEIEGLKSREEPDSFLRSLENNIAVLLETTSLPPTSRNGLVDINEINSDLPVMSSQVGANVYLWFDISRLQSIDSARAAVTTDPGYNGKSITLITADTPIELEGVDGLATVSFDMTTLLDA